MTSAQDTNDAALGKLLLERGRVRELDLSRVRRLAEAGEGGLPGLLVRLGITAEREMAEALADLLGLPLVSPEDYPEEPLLNGTISARFLKESLATPIGERDESVIFAAADPRDRFMRRALELACGRPVVLHVGVPSEIEAAITRQSEERTESAGDEGVIGDGEDVREEDIEHLKDLASEAPVVRWVNGILRRAVEERASDIHIEPFEERLKVRLRIDGVLRDAEAPPARSAAAVISRVKILAKLNIAERRLPQDGRIKLRSQGRELDLRVSTVPTLYGESVVLRLLDKESVVLDFPALGFEGAALERFLEVLDLPHGILLVTGPTGSGKTTTLYTALHRINTPERKIITVEDPVEYQLEGINQIQVKPQIGLTFANALRSILRQDPDVIMIGEMRDLETAGIAAQSALTGHLVLSTLHTNDAAGGVARLLDMGVEDYLITSTVNGILGQRLVRRLCPHCREAHEPLPEVVEEFGLRRLQPEGPLRLWQPVGCPQCAGIGYRGRNAITELLVMSDGIRRLVMQHATAGEIFRLAREEGMKTMHEDGLGKALAGVTSLEEVLRVTGEAD